MGTPETGREPFPGCIIDDVGGGFSMGVIFGCVYHFIKGSRKFPNGERFSGGIQTMRINAPGTGGGMAVWVGSRSIFEYAMVELRQKEDPWNRIFAGALAGGLHKIRGGFRSTYTGAVIGGLAMALVEGASIMMTKYFSPIRETDNVPKNYDFEYDFD